MRFTDRQAILRAAATTTQTKRRIILTSPLK